LSGVILVDFRLVYEGVDRLGVVGLDERLGGEVCQSMGGSGGGM
jgi:hypothetical protein